MNSLVEYVGEDGGIYRGTHGGYTWGISRGIHGGTHGQKKCAKECSKNKEECQIYFSSLNIKKRWLFLQIC
jgi:hypothetical protein